MDNNLLHCKILLVNALAPDAERSGSSDSVHFLPLTLFADDFSMYYQNHHSLISINQCLLNHD